MTPERRLEIYREEYGLNNGTIPCALLDNIAIRIERETLLETAKKFDGQGTSYTNEHVAEYLRIMAQEVENGD